MREVDNLLLEWILALHFEENKGIIPVIFGSHIKDNQTQKIKGIRHIYEPHVRR